MSRSGLKHNNYPPQPKQVTNAEIYPLGSKLGTYTTKGRLDLNVNSDGFTSDKNPLCINPVNRHGRKHDNYTSQPKQGTNT